MTNLVIISVALAVAAFFGWHIVSVLHIAFDGRRRQQEIDELRKDLNDALENGHIGRAAYLRARLSKLLDE